MVWVHEDVRRDGWGRGLLAAAEHVARERGCHQIIVSSFTFQAPEFYERCDYVETGRITGLPLDGMADVQLIKCLTACARRARRARGPSTSTRLAVGRRRVTRPTATGSCSRSPPVSASCNSSGQGTASARLKIDDGGLARGTGEVERATAEAVEDGGRQVTVGGRHVGLLGAAQQPPSRRRRPSGSPLGTDAQHGRLD